SAFVDIGLERDAFLYVSDVISPDEAVERFETDDEAEEAPAPSPEAMAAADAAQDALEETAAEPSGDGDDASGDGNGQSAPAVPAAINGRSRAQSVRRSGPGGRRERAARGGGAPQASEPGGGQGAPPERLEPRRKIEELLKEGQEILVQIVKEPLGTKGARITSHLSLPGRFLVFMPTVDHVGVSRKIESREERGRLRGLVKSFRQEHDFGGGVIIRTAAAGRPEADINADLQYFHDVWKEIRGKMESSRAPSVIYREQSLVAKLLRDLLNEQYSAIRIDNEQEYKRVVALIERFMPSMLPRIKHYTRDYPIFDE